MSPADPSSRDARGGSNSRPPHGIPESMGDQTLSDGDQTLSDGDQTLSDSDQTLSDSDQRASDDEQNAADRERAEGGDPAAYERASASRLESTRARLQTTDFREEMASERDVVARLRDGQAAQRDKVAQARDELARDADCHDKLYDKHTLRVQEWRARAAAQRRRAADDRERAAGDRHQAARDRARAASDREQAARDREHAAIDELTGARRRGIGLDELQREIDRAHRTGGTLVAVYIDVDDLKSVNDEHGHSAGDELLREVVEGLKRHTRSYDLIVRLGGDEFLCALPDIDVEAARGRFDRMASELAAGSIVRSISAGITELHDGESSQDLIENADRDLLAARSR